MLKMGNRFPEIMFLNEKNVNLYFAVASNNLRNAAELAHMNYSHARKILFYWEKAGLVTKDKPLKSFRIKYTSKGQRVYEVLLAGKTVLQNTGVQFVGHK